MATHTIRLHEIKFLYHIYWLLVLGYWVFVCAHYNDRGYSVALVFSNFINLLGMLGIDGILMQWDWIEWDVDGRLHVYHAWSSWVSLTMLKYCFITSSMCGITFEFMLKWDMCVCMYVCMCTQLWYFALCYGRTVSERAKDVQSFGCMAISLIFFDPPPSLILLLFYHHRHHHHHCNDSEYFRPHAVTMI